MPTKYSRLTFNSISLIYALFMMFYWAISCPIWHFQTDISTQLCRKHYGNWQTLRDTTAKILTRYKIHTFWPINSLRFMHANVLLAPNGHEHGTIGTIGSIGTIGIDFNCNIYRYNWQKYLPSGRRQTANVCQVRESALALAQTHSGLSIYEHIRIWAGSPNW